MAEILDKIEVPWIGKVYWIIYDQTGVIQP